MEHGRETEDRLERDFKEGMGHGEYEAGARERLERGPGGRFGSEANGRRGADRLADPSREPEGTRTGSRDVGIALRTLSDICPSGRDA